MRPALATLLPLTNCLPRLTGLTVAAACLLSAHATNRIFTYSYEPETMPKGAREFEQWVTARAGRTSKAGKDHYVRWDIREEFEYGVTDWYTAALYLNLKQESYRRPTPLSDFSELSFKGVSVENRFQVLNPAKAPVGLALYLEGGIGGDEAEIETKVILGQRHGAWKWALNLIYEHEWEHDFSDRVGKVGGTVGIGRDLGRGWNLGVELWSDSQIADYESWENSALFVGPVVSYRQPDWWIALTVMPQVWGTNFGSDPDGEPNLDLKSHERVNVRLLFGIDF